MEHGIRNVEAGEHAVCSRESGVRIKDYGVRSVEYEGWRMKHGVQSIASGV